MEIEKFLEIAAKLKSVRRQGWVERGVRAPESSADHSWMVAVMALTLPFDGNRDKAVKMALLHDLAEAEVGDIITKENWPKEGRMHEKEKVAREREAMKEMLSGLDKNMAKELVSLWGEFSEGKTKEAVFVRDIDVAERLMQAHRYHRDGNFMKPLGGFWDEKAMGTIKSESIKTLVKRIIGEGQ